MLESDIQIKPTLSPFHPLPAIGQKLERSKTKVIVFDLNKDKHKIHDVLKPLTPLRIHGYRKKSLDLDVRRPQQLLRENTYDVIEPLYLNIGSKDNEAAKAESDEVEDTRPKASPKTRFKKAAMQVVKLSSMPETGKLLCLRERQTYTLCKEEDKTCKLEQLPQTPEQKLNKLSEIFQNLELKGRCRDKMKKENSWF